MMRSSLLLVVSIALTILCWGLYGPVLQGGAMGMSTIAGRPASLRPFVCVGLAYFLIGVIVPSVWLYLKGEKGDWTIHGIIWSLIGGAMGAVGALGIILAFRFGGQASYVMPLVFGGAPVINAFITIYLADRMKEIGPVFLAGLVMVIIGAVAVLMFAPRPEPKAAPVAAQALPADTTSAAAVTPPTPSAPPSGPVSWVSRMLAIALAIACWGAYGPTLHKGQAAMHHSRLRALVCVGLAYFAIAVVVPDMILAESPESSVYSNFVHGTLPALMGGAFGALGAVGIIMAFNSGGRPVYVMPLVFGAAPVVNILFTAFKLDLLGKMNAMFLAGLILVVAGAVMVLVFAPRGDAPAAATR
ncbi:MAG TPA: hypothetical protein VGM76_18000 [Lacipirellulaceae bacterium]